VRRAFVGFLTIGKNVMLSPRVFFRNMSITEGIRKAVYFAVFIYYIRSVVEFIVSYRMGYFFNPVIRVGEPFTFYAAILMSLIPFFLLLVLYSQAIFINRIGAFFGGIANFEGAFKILAFVLFISMFAMVPFVGIFMKIYAMLALVIGVKIVFDMDWISSILTLFFSYIFTMVLYLILIIIPALLSKMVFVNL
jgi:hypothetical protein